MIILPAIDIKNGQCVRLLRGDFGTVSKVAESPTLSAENFKSKGAEFLHVVDLDGAIEGKPVNYESVAEIVKVGLPIEIGGGIRTVKDFELYLSLGVKKIILGSAAIKNTRLVRDLVKEYGDFVSVGIDACNGYVRTEGWLDHSNVLFTDIAKFMEEIGAKNIIYTDISRDGTLGGVNTEHLEKLKKVVSVNITASGGVHDTNDILACKKLDIYGVICGKSLYSGSLDLKEALECCQNG